MIWIQILFANLHYQVFDKTYLIKILNGFFILSIHSILIFFFFHGSNSFHLFDESYSDRALNHTGKYSGRKQIFSATHWGIEALVNPALDIVVAHISTFSSPAFLSRLFTRHQRRKLKRHVFASSEPVGPLTRWITLGARRRRSRCRLIEFRQVCLMTPESITLMRAKEIPTVVLQKQRSGDACKSRGREARFFFLGC